MQMKHMGFYFDGEAFLTIKEDISLNIIHSLKQS